MDEEKKANETPDPTKKIKKVEICVLSVFLALVLAAVGFVAGWFGRWGALGKKKQALLWAIDTAQSNYYREIDEDLLYDRLYGVFELDPYSGFYPAEDFSTVIDESEGRNADAGFAIWEEEHPLQIYSVKENSIAKNAGIAEGMYLLKYGKTNDEKQMLTAGSVDGFYTFLGALSRGEEFYALCGENERKEDATVYTLKNGEEDDADIGLSVSMVREPMRVYQVVGNSSADRAGLKRGMYILKYGATDNVTEMRSGSYASFQSFIGTLKSNTFYLCCGFDKAGTDAKTYPVSMEAYSASYCLYRDNQEGYRFRSDKAVNDKGELIKPVMVKTHEKLNDLDDKTAYISFSQFTADAAKEFEQCLKIMKDKGRKNLILDLRGNGGGNMDVLQEIAAYLMREGSGSQKIAYGKFRNGATVSYSAKSEFGSYFAADSRITVLADEYTASASECLIGAMIDYKTCNYSDIYLHQDGRTGVARTYGKGIMQTFYEDSEGNALKLTAADLYWPKSNKTIHGTGITVADGANAIESPLLPGADDVFLKAVIEKL